MLLSKMRTPANERQASKDRIYKMFPYRDSMVNSGKM